MGLTRNDTKGINKRTNGINVADNRESAVNIVLSAALIVIHSLGASEGSSGGRSSGNERVIRHFGKPCSECVENNDFCWLIVNQNPVPESNRLNLSG
jgi:hypothetical protein